jgi:uncharacterized membrane protein
MSEDNPKSILNLSEAVARPLCYVPVLGVLLSGVFLVLEKSQRVRKDALQAIFLWVFVGIFGWMLQVSIIAKGLVPLVNLIGMIVVPLILAIKANKGEETRIPVLAELAEAAVGMVRKKRNRE